MHSGAALLERRAAMASATVNSARVVMTTVTCPRGLHAVRPRGPVPLGGLVVRRTTPGPGAAMKTVYAAPTYGKIMLSFIPSIREDIEIILLHPVTFCKGQQTLVGSLLKKSTLYGYTP